MLADALRSADPQVVRHAARAAGRIGDTGLTDTAAEVVLDHSRRLLLRIAATAALSAQVAPAYRPSLLALLEDASQAVMLRGEVLLKMQWLDDETLAPLCSMLMRDGECEVRAAAVLRTPDGPDLRSIISLGLADPEALVRLKAVDRLLLSSRGLVEGAHLLDMLASDPCRRIRVRVLDALRTLYPDDLPSGLAIAAEDTDPLVNAHALAYSRPLLDQGPPPR